jgi:serine/threonine protein kinase
MVSVKELHFGQIIGRGNFGRVYKGTWKGLTVALKCIALPPGSDISLLPTPKEVEVLRLAHAIVTVHLFSETTII